MNKITSSIILITVIVIAVWGIVSLSNSRSADDTNATSTDEATTSFTVPDGWEKYKSQDASFTFKKPSNAELSMEAGRLKLQILGENNQPNTEVTDGITAYISTKKVEGQSLREAAERVFVDRKATSQEVITTLTEDEFAGETGFFFELRNQLGSVTAYRVLPASNGQAYVISYTASGEDSQEYAETIEIVASSLNYQPDESESINQKKSATSSDDTGDEDNQRYLAQ